MSNFLWDSLRSVAEKVGEVTAKAGHQTKVHTEMLLIDRELKARKQTFGVELYEYVEKISRTPEFFASDDLLTATLRPSLLKAQREIAALNNKRVKQRTNLETAKAQRAAVSGGSTWQETVISTAKITAMAGGEAKLHTELVLMENEMTHYKCIFGEEIYVEFERLEDEKGWLPTDREIRSIYDQCRRDIEKIQKKKSEKARELAGGSATGDEVSVNPTPFPNHSAAQPYSVESPVAAPASYQDPSSATPTVFATRSTPSVPVAAYSTPTSSGYTAPAPSPATASFASSGYSAPVATPAYATPAYVTPASTSFSSSGGYSSPAPNVGYSAPTPGYSVPAPKATVPSSNPNWMNQPDPFSPASQTTNASGYSAPQQAPYSASNGYSAPHQSSHAASAPTQQPYDPFASAPQPIVQQSGNISQSSNTFSAPAPASSYDDPFAGLSNFQ